MDSVQVRILFIIRSEIPIFLSAQTRQFRPEKEQSECLFKGTSHIGKFHNNNQANIFEEQEIDFALLTKMRFQNT